MPVKNNVKNNPTSLLAQLTDTLTPEQIQTLNTLEILELVDGRGLACPMPLLKTKIALRKIKTPNQAIYTVATDPHSQTDIHAFCQQSHHNIQIFTKTHEQDNKTNHTQNTEKSNTIFHFIITKTHSNS